MTADTKAVDTDDALFWQDPQLEGRTVRHLVFVVHGMGRQLEERGKYRDNIRDMRQTLRQVMDDELCRTDEAVAVIPIEWHSILHDKVDKRMSRTTLVSCAAMRMLCNEYLGDVLYYFTERHGQLIVNMVAEQLNAKYHAFMAQQPDFAGEVTLLGFSLGGVCCYDIMARQPEGVFGRHPTDRITAPQLAFRPSHLFTLGSPIGAIMVMRDWQMDDLQLPRWCRHQNIFHPCDPMGYRLEPLIAEQYAEIPAVSIDHLPQRSRSMQLLEWMAPRRPASLLPGVGHAIRFISAFAGYMYGAASPASSVAQQVGDDSDDSMGNGVAVEGSVHVAARRCRKRRRVSSSGESNNGNDGDDDHRDEDAWWSGTEEVQVEETMTMDVQLTGSPASMGPLDVIDVLDSDEENDDNDHGGREKQRHDAAVASALPAAGSESMEDVASAPESVSADAACAGDYVHVAPDPLYQYATGDPAPLDRRIDFVLHDPRMRTLNEYVIGIRAHFSYWRNRDLMRHLLRCLGIETATAAAATTTDTATVQTPCDEPVS
ncbi:DDHD domain-containing protein [Thamnocephalis sphaerospora]|uniref:DDHD domain-containing protein n=1 Tax=Thamnocephalis sphaerospora TaxID=78915 RepID=A0A4P9XQ38_9FUNG|nr:DDHD domain-containing protein [Thamnocephalis sphaerospora]|eukprot:RKP08128.1 DDHD domain-containing protein [Thamnocephalis sphaerospora]